MVVWERSEYNMQMARIGYALLRRGLFELEKLEANWFSPQMDPYSMFIYVDRDTPIA